MNCTRRDPCKTFHEWDSREAMLRYVEGHPELSLEEYEPRHAQNLSYLATMTVREERGLLRDAADMLASGWWHLERGDVLGQSAAEQITRRANGLDEPKQFTIFARGIFADDLAGQLRIGRGWCPEHPSDSHQYVPNTHETVSTTR